MWPEMVKRKDKWTVMVIVRHTPKVGHFQDKNDLTDRAECGWL